MENAKKYPVLGSFAAKTAAVILLCVFGIGILFGGLGVLYSINYEMYNVPADATYYDTAQCRNTVYQNAKNIALNYAQGNTEIASYEYREENSNIVYRLYTMDEKTEETLVSENYKASGTGYDAEYYVTADYAGKEPVLVCILKGAVIFFSDLIREIDLPLTADFMAISSYGSATKTSGVVRVLKDLDKDILGKDVIIVEDIVDTGVTLNYLKSMLAHRGAASIRIAALLDKTARRTIKDLKVDYVCFDIPDAFVVGYGLDYDQTYRNLPDIGVLSPKIYEGK